MGSSGRGDGHDMLGKSPTLCGGKSGFACFMELLLLLWIVWAHLNHGGTGDRQGRYFCCLDSSLYQLWLSISEWLISPENLYFEFVALALRRRFSVCVSACWIAGFKLSSGVRDFNWSCEWHNFQALVHLFSVCRGLWAPNYFSLKQKLLISCDEASALCVVTVYRVYSSKCWSQNDVNLQSNFQCI
jgi:hypothetical protein